MPMHFDWVPYFKGKYLTYYQYFALVGSSVAILLAFLNFVIYLIVAKFSPNQQPSNLQQDLNKQANSKKLQTFFFKAIFVCLSLVPLFCSAMTVIPTLAGIIGMFAVYVAMIYLNNFRNYQRFTYHYLGNMNWLVNFRRSWKFQNIKIKKNLIIALAVSLILPIFMHRTCLCFYNAEIGYYNHALGFGINTMLTRFFQLKKACPPGPPCHFYATVPEDASYAVFINLHTHTNIKDNVTIFYQQIDSYNVSQFYKTTATTYHHLGLDYNDQRNIHSALITDLKANTKYLIKVFYDNQFWTNAIYKTLPDDPSVPVRMINAGDSGYTEPAIQLTKIVSTLKPDIFFIGGDIAYDDNMPACVYTWDYYLNLYGSLTSTIGYLMPLVLTVGNHDVGLNELPGVNITVNQHSPAYLIYFPQHYDRDPNFKITKAIPPIKRRRTVFYHTFSNVQYVSLDSGYMQLFEGFQQNFLKDSLKMYPNKVKFVNYHVPLYSGCQKFDRNSQRFLNGLFHWVPHFDNYKVMTSFENHVHSFKRTKPLIGNSPKENGTVYVGDGAFGAILSEFCKPDITVQIFQKQFSSNNFWLSVIGKDKVDHYAYNTTGHIIDSFTQNVVNYI